MVSGSIPEHNRQINSLTVRPMLDRLPAKPLCFIQDFILSS
jgi:hypothetical protein